MRKLRSFGSCSKDRLHELLGHLFGHLVFRASENCFEELDSFPVSIHGK